MTTVIEHSISNEQEEKLLHFINTSSHIHEEAREAVKELIAGSLNLRWQRALVLRTTNDLRGRELILAVFHGIAQLAYHTHPENGARLNHVLQILGSDMQIHVEFGEYEAYTDSEGISHEAKDWFNTNALGCTVFLNRNVTRHDFDMELLQYQIRQP